MTDSRKKAILALAAAAAVSFSGCDRSHGSKRDFHVDVSAQGQDASAAGQGRPGETDPAAKGGTPKLPPRDGETLLGVFNLNLDSDAEEEQVCVIKRRDDSSSFIRVAILDQRDSGGSWTRVWDGATLATKYPTFNLSVKDLLGAHTLDLVCSGMNDSGRQTLSAFHPDSGDNGQNRSYSAIVSIEADAVEVEESERGEAYSLAQTSGSPWDVLSYEQDQSSSNYLDQIETRWAWNAAKRAYEKGNPRKISGYNIEQKVIERYLNRDSATFEGFLSGIWRLNLGDGKDPGASRILQFDPESRTIAFAEKGDLASLSVFNWIDSQTTKLGLFISTQNTAVSSMKRFVEAELRGPDSIAVRVIEDVYMRVDTSTQWNGIYRKLGTGQEGQTRAAGVKTLSGRYRSSTGAELVFSPPRFEWRDGTDDDQGVFSQYALGEASVIVLKSMKASGIITRTRTFRLDRRERKGTAGAYEEISLSPARTTASGLELLDQEPITLRLAD